MHAHCCQRTVCTADEGHQSKTWLQRIRGATGLIIPGTVLALLPKCPMCLAAYIALCTGFTISRSSANLLMRTLIALCICTLALCLICLLLRFFHNKSTLNLQPATNTDEN